MQKTHSFYSIISDPSDSYSNHWSNAPELEKGQCPKCLSLESFKTSKLKTTYCCKKCFTKFD